ncbi:helix-turn-helix domain-containing protein [Yinghuangia aomiensis]
MALLAGIGVTWYTWLEQGRSINVSAQVLLSVVRVLGLDDVERAHVFRLAELPDPELVVSVPQVGRGCRRFSTSCRLFPAAVDRAAVGRSWRAAGAHVEGLMGDYPACADLFCATSSGWCSPTRGGSALTAATGELAARPLVAKMRGASAADAGDPGWAQLLDRAAVRVPGVLRTVGPAGRGWLRQRDQVPVPPRVGDAEPADRRTW